MPREGTKKYADPPRTQHCSITHRIVTKVMGNLLITFRKQVGSGPTCAVINSHHTRRLRQWRCFPSPLAYAYTGDAEARLFDNSHAPGETMSLLCFHRLRLFSTLPPTKPLRLQDEVESSCLQCHDAPMNQRALLTPVPCAEELQHRFNTGDGIR